MEKQWECRVLREDDFEDVRTFHEKTNKDGLSSESPSFMLWTSPFREESLRHYISANWCLASLHNENYGAVLLQKVLPFWNGLTQVMWIEAIHYDSQKACDAVLKTAHGIAREKHLQAMAFSETADWSPLLARVGLVREMSEHGDVVKTAKW